MFRLIDRRLPAFNTQTSSLHFLNFDDACDYAKSKGIREEQEFWFTIVGDDNLYSCLVEFLYEG